MTTAQPKQFNTAGPCIPSKHYMLPALPRLPDVQSLIGDEAYFLLHAPRQSGKTTAIRIAVKQLNEEGVYYALYCSLQQLRMVTDKTEAMNVIIGLLDRVLSESPVDDLKMGAGDDFRTSMPTRPGFNTSPIQVWLSALCARLDKDLVIFFDEADCLEEQALLSFLSQLRDGYTVRDDSPFPRSIALIGMRSLRDYKARIRPESKSMGSASPFNIIKKALTLSNFTQDEVKTLYAQHTEATGQVFMDEALERTWYWSEGQPWLVNALACEVIEEILARDYGPTITPDHIDKAASNLMIRRDTHIDSLLDRLHDSRVSRFIEPMLAISTDEESSDSTDIGKNAVSYNDDLQYCLDLGLIKKAERLRPANPFYACVISRFINERIQYDLPEELIGKWMDSKTIDMTGLIKGFQSFWAERAERIAKDRQYKESDPHNVLTAYLQRVVNGGATVIEEYALGRGYVDIVVRYAGRNYVIELKIKDNQRSKAASQQQILGYMDRLVAKEGWLMIFDRKSKKSWTKKITWETVTVPTGQTIHVVGC